MFWWPCYLEFKWWPRRRRRRLWWLWGGASSLLSAFTSDVEWKTRTLEDNVLWPTSWGLYTCRDKDLHRKWVHVNFSRLLTSDLLFGKCGFHVLALCYIQRYIPTQIDVEINSIHISITASETMTALGLFVSFESLFMFSGWLILAAVLRF